jgi:hypothetical protein
MTDNNSLRDKILEEVVANAYDGGAGPLDGLQFLDMCVEITDAVLSVVIKEITND